MVYDLGDVAYLNWATVDKNGTAADVTTAVVTITLPDGTSATPSVTHGVTGAYSASYTPTQQGRHVLRWVGSGTNPQAYTDEFTVRDLNTLPVVSYDSVLAHLNIPSSYGNEEEIRRFMDAAQDLAEGYVGAVLGRRTFTEYYDGNTDIIRLNNPRAISITTVIENGVTLGSADYKLDSTGQRLHRLTSASLTQSTSSAYGYWATGVNAVQVTYTAGYAITPPAIQQGVLEIIRHLWTTQRGAVNVMSRTGTGDDFYPGATYSLPRRAMELLDPASLPGLA